MCWLWLNLTKHLEGDVRSDEEEEDSDSPKEGNHKLSHMNGSGARGRANGHWHTKTVVEEKKDGQQKQGHFLHWSTAPRI